MLLFAVYSFLYLLVHLWYLDDWSSFEKDYTLSLSGITNDLEARLPLTGGARVYQIRSED